MPQSKGYKRRRVLEPDMKFSQPIPPLAGWVYSKVQRNLMKRSIELAFLLDDKGKFWLFNLESEKCISNKALIHYLSQDLTLCRIMLSE